MRSENVARSIGAETIWHGWARAHPLFVSGGHGGGGTGKAHQAQRRELSSFTEYQTTTWTRVGIHPQVRLLYKANLTANVVIQVD